MAQKESKLKNTLQNVGYYALLGFAKLIGYLPYFVLYRMLAPFIYFILYRVIGYRKPIVRVNLELAFPEKSEEERREIERKFYHHLSEIFVDVVDMTSMSPKELQRRMQVVNE